MNILLPAFSENNISIVFSCDENFIPYFGVCLRSLLDTTSENNNYDIIILENNITNWKKRRITDIAQGMRNVSIRFVDVSNYLDTHKKIFYTRGERYSTATYARFLIPDLLSAYSKTIYLDADIYVKNDVANLYSIDIGTNLIGAAADYAMYVNWYGGKNNVDKYKYAYNYLSNVLKLKEITEYFQAGIMIMNLDECRRFNLLKKAVDYLHYVNTPLHVDQDVLNFITRDRIKIIDSRWNFQWHLMLDEYSSLKYLPYDIYENIQAISDDFYIIHYCSVTRPWTHPAEKNAHLFWTAAQNTVFYEEILYQNLSKKIATIESKERHRIDYQLSIDLANYSQLKKQYWLVRLKKLFTLSKKKRQKYRDKISVIRKKIKTIREICRHR